MRSHAWSKVFLVSSLVLAAQVATGEESKVKKEAKEAAVAVKETARDVGHGTRDAAKEVGKAVKEAARETGHAFRDGAKELKESIRDADKKESKK